MKTKEELCQKRLFRNLQVLYSPLNRTVCHTGTCTSYITRVLVLVACTVPGTTSPLVSQSLRKKIFLARSSTTGRVYRLDIHISIQLYVIHSTRAGPCTCTWYVDDKEHRRRFSGYRHDRTVREKETTEFSI